jgi:hypothetical protein
MKKYQGEPESIMMPINGVRDKQEPARICPPPIPVSNVPPLPKQTDPTNVNKHSKGRKGDLGKPHMCLMPPKALLEIGKVLSFGAVKYAPDNWRDVKPRCRYLSAMDRHYLAFLAGEKVDEETGIHHLAHLGCCVLFALELELEGVDVDDWTSPEARAFFENWAGFKKPQE